MIIRPLLVCTSLIVLSACQSKNASPQGSSGAAPSMKVQAFIVSSKQLNSSFNVSGTLLASEQTDLHPEVSGRVTALTIHEGSTVKAGDLLVKLYDADLQAQKKKLEVQLEIAHKNEQRMKELFAVHGASQQDYDLAILQSSNVAADIDIVKSSITKTEIRAPFSGKVGLRTISPGAYVTPATMVASIREMGQLKLDFSVPEKYSSFMKNGQIVKFTVSGNSESFNAKVIATESDVNEQNRTLKVRALVQSSSDKLAPGAFANVSLTLDSKSTSLMIPTQALIPQARDKKVILVKDGKAKFVSVTTGIRSNSEIEITSGIQESDTVVTTGLLFVKPDTKVDISTFTH